MIVSYEELSECDFTHFPPRFSLFYIAFTLLSLVSPCFPLDFPWFYLVFSLLSLDFTLVFIVFHRFSLQGPARHAREAVRVPGGQFYIEMMILQWIMTIIVLKTAIFQWKISILPLKNDDFSIEKIWFVWRLRCRYFTHKSWIFNRKWDKMWNSPLIFSVFSIEIQELWGTHRGQSSRQSSSALHSPRCEARCENYIDSFLSKNHLLFYVEQSSDTSATTWLPSSSVDSFLHFFISSFLCFFLYLFISSFLF